MALTVCPTTPLATFATVLGVRTSLTVVGMVGEDRLLSFVATAGNLLVLPLLPKRPDVTLVTYAVVVKVLARLPVVTVGGIRMNAHKTAIGRNKPSRPAMWLDARGLIKGIALDYGCGRGKDADTYGMDSYDPHYGPEMPTGLFDTILCSFVLNVIESEEEREQVIQDIRNRLVAGGRAYLTVRNDKAKLNGTTSIGTWQGLIELDLPIVYRCAGYIIYELS